MEFKNVSKTTELNLCTSCGICKGICPKECISWNFTKGIYRPKIDEGQCIDCGLCAKVCPGLQHKYTECSDAVSTVTGKYLETYNAWSNDEDIRHVSASSGVVSSLIKELLSKNQYNIAFCLDSYKYSELLTTKAKTIDDFSGDWLQSSIPKSRYLPVSHENAVKYLKCNRNERIIFVGTSCAIRGLVNVIEQLKLDRTQYLLIGLFCDQIFNYNFPTLMEDRFCKDCGLDSFHFKNKESGGWPGNMKIFPKNKEAFYCSKSERVNSKAYFMPERCLYCVDKLNVLADISVGDNYTTKNYSEKGTNSVIIRTKKGLDAWQQAVDRFEISKIHIQDIIDAQVLSMRLKNLYYADLWASRFSKGHNLNVGVPRNDVPEKYTKDWNKSLKKLKLGANYDTSPLKYKFGLKRDAFLSNPKNPYRLVRRGFGLIKRRMLKLLNK